jgi:hypothetical protein
LPPALLPWPAGKLNRSSVLCNPPGLEGTEKVITTRGNRLPDRPLPEMGGKGVFTQELEDELLSGRVHAAVHLLKDLPVENPPDLAIAPVVTGAIPARRQARNHANGCPAGGHVPGRHALRKLVGNDRRDRHAARAAKSGYLTRLMRARVRETKYISIFWDAEPLRRSTERPAECL